MRTSRCGRRTTLAGAMTEEEARWDARRRFGNSTLVKEDTWAMDLVGWMENLRQDLRYAVRMLRRRSGCHTGGGGDSGAGLRSGIAAGGFAKSICPGDRRTGGGCRTCAGCRGNQRFTVARADKTSRNIASTSETRKGFLQAGASEEPWAAASTRSPVMKMTAGW